MKFRESAAAKGVRNVRAPAGHPLTQAFHGCRSHCSAMDRHGNDDNRIPVKGMFPDRIMCKVHVLNGVAAGNGSCDCGRYFTGSARR